MGSEEWSLKSAAPPAGFKLHLHLLFLLSPSPSFNCRFPLRSTVLNHRFLHADGTSDDTSDGTRTWRGADDLRDKSERFEYWLAWSNIYFIDSDVNQQMFYRRKISWIINYEFTTLFDSNFNILNGVYVRYGILNTAPPPLIWNWPGWFAKWRRDFKYVERLTIWEKPRDIYHVFSSQWQKSPKSDF